MTDPSNADVLQELSDSLRAARQDVPAPEPEPAPAEPVHDTGEERPVRRPRRAAVPDPE